METTHNENSRKLQSVPPAIDNVPIRRVLVSVFDKTGIDQLAVGLKAAGVRVASTGGTATALAAHGLEVEDVSQSTGVCWISYKDTNFAPVLPQLLYLRKHHGKHGGGLLSISM